MDRSYRNTLFLFAGLVGMGLFLAAPLLALIAAPASPALAAGDYQNLISTPTPGPDGRIIYIVKANDSLLSISLWSGVSVDTLRGLNNLSNDIIFPGQELLLGLAAPSNATATPGPSPTPTEVLPTATPRPGTGTLCVILFNDVNGDSFRHELEPSLPGGAISIDHRDGKLDVTIETEDGLEHSCQEDVGEGIYNITVAIPDGYNATTLTSATINLKQGDVVYMDFGAQANTETIEAQPEVTGERRSPLLGILGGALLIGGLGLALIAGRWLKR